MKGSFVVFGIVVILEKCHKVLTLGSVALNVNMQSIYPVPSVWTDHNQGGECSNIRQTKVKYVTEPDINTGLPHILKLA